MKIQLMSDLHLEVDPGFVPVPAADADLLVLAGDIGAYPANSRLGGDDFGLTRFSPRHGWPVPVLYLPGNHEYDGRDFDGTHAQLRAVCERLGITWLERETRVIDGVRFIGTTLWSDFDALAWAAAPVAPSEEALHLARAEAFVAADRYLRTTGTTVGGQPMLAGQVRDLALVCQRWLRGALAQPFEGRTVVVTHFAPSLRSADPRYGLVPGTAGFCSALDDLLPRAQFWLHGHLHAPSDYVHEGCRVLANPLGYARAHEQESFTPAFVIDLDA